MSDLCFCYCFACYFCKVIVIFFISPDEAFSRGRKYFVFFFDFSLIKDSKFATKAEKIFFPQRKPVEDEIKGFVYDL